MFRGSQLQEPPNLCLLIKGGQVALHRVFARAALNKTRQTVLPGPSIAGLALSLMPVIPPDNGQSRSELRFPTQH